ncbi:restriction endonuclease subunit S [Pseudomonas sediminis]|nr:restriction endonuclease subunit S [Pseudomonas sediminis]
MSSEWPITTIGELAADDDGAIAIGPFGSSMKADVYTATGVPVVRGTNLKGQPGFSGDVVFVPKEVAARFARCVVRPGDLVFPHRGAIGEVGLVTAQGYDEWMLSTSMMKLRTHPEKLDPHFAFYYFRSPAGRHQLLRNASQVGTPGISQPLASLRACEIVLPPLREQRAIVEVLQALDEKIEQNRKTGQALDELVRATFKAWFVDFEPVKAKAAGQTSFPGMPPAVFAALPDCLTDSLNGPVPQGVVVRTLAEVFDINPPRRLSKGQDAPYLDMKNMPTNGHAPDAWERRPHGSGMRFINGDTLVARITPCLENGKTAFVDFLKDDEVAWGSTEYIVLRPKPPLPQVYAYCLARTSEFRDFAIQNMTGTSGRQRVAASALEHYHVAVPDAVTAAAFGDIALPLFECIRAGKAESSKLAALRDYLLPRLLSGAVRVASKGAS